MNESKRTKETLKLVNPKSSAREEEMLFQERIETFWKAFQKMSSFEKRKEVNRLFLTFNKYQKRMEALIFQWKDLFEKEREVKRKLRVIGERTRGIRKA
ncbi:hypothetical protein [Leptospira stimsonii]|uniref:Uncharacterized protein n=1 Tax=Leptospira stimsonii TaxID=2202203 RepID=A0ABY2MWN0_9LEPT|nr:hypothetical protein [Leptospira stimsonii]TGK23562.1 hypothetical protein EHO98_05010 [Leptospira stimsonii]TGM10259.1 hypothetical protein EHQ90_19180 [Leptospira stimsonii]